MGPGRTSGEGIDIVTRHVIGGAVAESGGRGGLSDERRNGMTMMGMCYVDRERRFT